MAPVRHRAGQRRGNRKHHRRNGGADPYQICLSTLAVACLIGVVAVLATRPRWDTSLAGLPLGAFILGALGGLLTLASFPSWPRRLDHSPRRVVAVTLYRLGSAFLVGGIGFLIAAPLSGRGELGWLPFAAAFAAGIAEMPINGGLLKALGMVSSQSG